MDAEIEWNSSLDYFAEFLAFLETIKAIHVALIILCCTHFKKLNLLDRFIYYSGLVNFFCTHKINMLKKKKFHHA